MKCYNHPSRWAQAKIGLADGSMFAAFLPSFLKKFLKVKTWVKDEIYVCKECKDKYDKEMKKNG